MNILAWTLFGIVNGLMLYLFDANKEKTSPAAAVLMAVLGALSGGTLAYVLFGEFTSSLNGTLLLALFFEAILVYLLLSGRSFKKA